MSQSSTDPRLLRTPPKRPLRLSWSDERVRGIVWQILVVGVVGAIVWWLWSNTAHNLEVRRIATGFGFLWREGVTDPEAMTTLPRALRARLKERFSPEATREVEAEESRDGTVKLLLGLSDSARIETVLIPEGERRTGVLVEFDRTQKIFSNPSDERTEMYVTGRFG